MWMAQAAKSARSRAQRQAQRVKQTAALHQGMGKGGAACCPSCPLHWRRMMGMAAAAWAQAGALGGPSCNGGALACSSSSSSNLGAAGGRCLQLENVMKAL